MDGMPTAACRRLFGYGFTTVLDRIGAIVSAVEMEHVDEMCVCLVLMVHHESQNCYMYILRPPWLHFVHPSRNDPGFRLQDERRFVEHQCTISKDIQGSVCRRRMIPLALLEIQ